MEHDAITPDDNYKILKQPANVQPTPSNEISIVI